MPWVLARRIVTPVINMLVIFQLPSMQKKRKNMSLVHLAGSDTELTVPLAISSTCPYPALVIPANNHLRVEQEHSKRIVDFHDQSFVNVDA